VALGWTSLFNDTATEAAYWILPAFLTGPLGAGAAALGWIEGIAEGCASFARLASGWWTDRVGRRKPFVVAGYVAANVAKPLLALAASPLHVLAIRVSDRISKGVRTAPRDAMLAESAEAAHRGAAFGFRQAMDSAGAVLGPLAAFLLLRRHFDLRTIFALAALPGAVCIFLVLAVVRETGTGQAPERSSKSAIRNPKSEIPLPPSFRRLLLAIGIFAIGNSSDLFLVLRAQGLGLGSYAPLLGLVFNVTYTLLAWPFGRLSDRLPRKSLLAAGYVVFAGVYTAFAWVHAAWQVWALFALYGGYYALTEGVMKAMVADAVEPESRGRAYGILAAVYGALVLAASLITGQLWQRFGPALPFTVSALLALIAAATVLAVPAPQKKQGSMPVSERPTLP
jgi:MFS family permease